MKRLPKGYRRGHDGSIACKHRDMFCCKECAAKHVEMVDVMGQHYWIPDEGERASMLAMLAKRTA